MTAALPVYHRGEVVDVVLVDADLADELGEYRWHWNGGYAVRGVPAGDPNSSAMHRQVCGLLRGDPRVVHHVNEDPLDNRRENLEVCASMSDASRRPHPKRDEASRLGWERYVQSQVAA